MSESEKILFHYTSLEGLLGIIKSQSIWATNILYLNDASELNYSIGLSKKQVLNFQGEIGNALTWEYRFFERLKKFIEHKDFVPSGRLGYFVCSFSQEKDVLSQWRGYCPKGIGFSLGFKFSKLKKCAQSHGFLIKRCIYDEKKQIDQLKKLIESTGNQLTTKFMSSSKDARDSIISELLVDLTMNFIKLAPTFKHPKFKEEKEWRIIAGLKAKTTELVKFRSGQSMVVPYIEIPLPKEGDNLIINQVVVGPTHDPLLSKASVEMLLKSNNVIFDEVQYSTIPYRNW